MGSPKKESGRWSKGNAENLRDITIESFYIAKYEVSQKDYFLVVKNEKYPTENEFLPIYNISWFEAIKFCNRLSELHGLEPAYIIFFDRILDDTFVNSKRKLVQWNKKASGYRLPTSAEWECAIRAGTKTPYYTGETLHENQANYNPGYPRNNNNKIMQVGSYPPNPWGLYDMAGNVWEWCWDWYEEWLPSTGKILRGGSFLSPVNELRSASLSCSPADSKGNYGFRLARNVAVPTNLGTDLPRSPIDP